MQLFVDTEYRGHHSEYLSIVVEKAISLDMEVCFLVHPSFLQSRPEIKSVKNVHIYTATSATSIWELVKEIRFIRQIVRLHPISHCCFLDLNHYFKLLPLLALKCKMSGIYFMPFLMKENVSWSEKIIKTFYFRHLLSHKGTWRIFLLNDKKAVILFNNYFQTNKFKYLVDPVYGLSEPKGENKTNLGQHLNFAFLGEISTRKGIFQLFKAIPILPLEILIQIDFTIAGNASHQKNHIEQSIISLKEKHPHLFREVILERISDKKFEEIISQTDIVLCLHQVLEGSSGIVGKAAITAKPIIGPHKGLIGELIQEYKLGKQIDTQNPEQIAMAITYAVEKGITINTNDSNRYVEERSPANFFITLSL